MSLIPLALAHDDIMKSLEARAMFQRDNPGTEWLASNFPHLMSQLQVVTEDWILFPKAAFWSLETLRKMVEMYRLNVSYGSPPLVDGLSPETYVKKVGDVLNFIQDKMMPVMDRMPQFVKEMNTDGFAEAFEGEDTGADGEDQYGENPGQAPEAGEGFSEN